MRAVPRWQVRRAERANQLRGVSRGTIPRQGRKSALPCVPPVRWRVQWQKRVRRHQTRCVPHVGTHASNHSSADTRAHLRVAVPVWTHHSNGACGWCAPQVHPLPPWQICYWRQRHEMHSVRSGSIPGPASAGALQRLSRLQAAQGAIPVRRQVAWALRPLPPGPVRRQAARVLQPRLSLPRDSRVSALPGVPSRSICVGLQRRVDRQVPELPGWEVPDRIGRGLPILRMPSGANFTGL